MTALLRQGASFALAVVCTWWILFQAPGPDGEAGQVDAAETVTGPVSLQVVTENAVDVATLEDVALDAQAEPSEPDPDPAPIPVPLAEAGARDGSDDGTVDEEIQDPDEGADADPAAMAADPDDVAVESDPSHDGPRRAEAASLAEDKELLDAASEELIGTAKLGFSTVLISSPEDQLDIARAFGEAVVLVPKAALDPDAKGVVSYRLDLSATSRIVEVAGRPPLENYRQYRDLFAYEFKRLPRPLRTLRNSVVRRDEVFLFAALIPVEEWAVVVGRRREAAQALGVRESDVERYVLRYVRLPGGQFDLSVDEVRLTDGRTLRPFQNSPQSSARPGRASR